MRGWLTGATTLQVRWVTSGAEHRPPRALAWAACLVGTCDLRGFLGQGCLLLLLVVRVKRMKTIKAPANMWNCLLNRFAGVHGLLSFPHDLGFEIYLLPVLL